MKRLLLLPAAGILLALGACEESPPAPSPPPMVTDTAPIGDGLKVIGFAMVGLGVILVLGRMLR